jgi:cupin fold WbuC family metalloprotein
MPPAVGANGAVKNRVSLSTVGANVVAEISRDDWHSIVFRAPGAVVLELMPGPYEPLLDKEFAGLPLRMTRWPGRSWLG